MPKVTKYVENAGLDFDNNLDDKQNLIAQVRLRAGILLKIFLTAAGKKHKNLDQVIKNFISVVLMHDGVIELLKDANKPQESSLGRFGRFFQEIRNDNQDIIQFWNNNIKAESDIIDNIITYISKAERIIGIKDNPITFEQVNNHLKEFVYIHYSGIGKRIQATLQLAEQNINKLALFNEPEREKVKGKKSNAANGLKNIVEKEQLNKWDGGRNTDSRPLVTAPAIGKKSAQQKSVSKTRGGKQRRGDDNDNDASKKKVQNRSTASKARGTSPPA